MLGLVHKYYDSITGLLKSILDDPDNISLFCCPNEISAFRTVNTNTTRISSISMEVKSNFYYSVPPNSIMEDG